MRVWVLTDGKAGDEQQCLGVAEALGGTARAPPGTPRAPFLWLMPWGPIDPREAPGPARQPDRAALPGPRRSRSGRRAVPYVRHVKRASRRAHLHGVPEGPAHRPGAPPT